MFDEGLFTVAVVDGGGQLSPLFTRARARAAAGPSGSRAAFISTGACLLLAEAGAEREREWWFER